MRRLLLLATMIASPAALANDLAQPVTAMVYWQQPIGSNHWMAEGDANRPARSAFG